MTVLSTGLARRTGQRVDRGGYSEATEMKDRPHGGDPTCGIPVPVLLKDEGHNLADSVSMLL